MELRKIAETTSTFTLGWDQVPNAEWYLFYADDKRLSNAPAIDKNGNPKVSIKYMKGEDVYEVVAITRLGTALYGTDVGVYRPTASSRVPAPPKEPFQVKDGGGTVQAYSDCFVRTSEEVLIEHKHVKNVTGYGIGSMQFSYASMNPPPKLTTIRDCIVENVRANPSGSMGGRGEANFWLGNPTLLQRCVARKSGWMAFNIVARSQGSVLEDVLIEDVPVGLYFEHATHDVTVRRLETRRILPQAVGGGTEPNGILAARSGTKEWWYRSSDYGFTGPYNITYEDSTIYCPAPDPRFGDNDPTCGDYNGPGCYGMRYLNCHFIGPGHAIIAPRIRANNGADVFIDDRCVFDNGGDRVRYHSLPMGV